MAPHVCCPFVRFITHTHAGRKNPDQAKPVRSARPATTSNNKLSTQRLFACCGTIFLNRSRWLDDAHHPIYLSLSIGSYVSSAVLLCCCIDEFFRMSLTYLLLIKLLLAAMKLPLPFVYCKHFPTTFSSICLFDQTKATLKEKSITDRTVCLGKLFPLSIIAISSAIYVLDVILE